MNYKNYIHKEIAHYERIRKNLDKELIVSIVNDREVVICASTSLQNQYIARTMEYIQGLKYDTEKIIEKLKKELEKYETNTKTNH